VRSAVRWIVVFAAIKLLLHFWSNGLYGFHRDELATYDDARHLAWGYVAYPPLTPFLGRIELMLFGDTPRAFRVFAALAQAVAIVLAALMARRLGGSAKAQWITAICVALSPVSLATSALFQYVAFDFLWWVLVCYFVTRLIETNDPRWWMGIGAAIGLGVMTKYTVAFFVAGLVAGVLATDFRKHLRSRWLWIGVAISIVIALPNLAWQATHDFVSLDFLRHIHERDVRIGRTKDFFLDQIRIATNFATLPVWIIGIIAAVRVRRLRIIAWMWIVPMVLFIVAKGRGYYTAPLYPIVFASGGAQIEAFGKKIIYAALAVLFAIGCIVIPFVVPIAQPGSRLFALTSSINHDYREEFGWPELTAEVARVWNTLPPAERAHAAVFCANYGEAGAIDRYGPAYGLPPVISEINSYWARGYGNPPPQTLIVVGFSRSFLDRNFAEVRVAGYIPNPLRLENEESERPNVYVVRGLKRPWQDFWKDIRAFG
jgi:hypothetical protein